MSENQLNNNVLTEEEIAVVRKPLDEASLLPAKVYGSEEIYQQECERVFPTSWLPICHVSRLDEPGKYVTKKLAGEWVIAIRGRDNEIRVISNVCRHRNVTLLQEESGQCKGNRIMCPYHGWTYSTDGKLLAAPFMEDSKDFNKKEFPLPEFNSEIWHGFLFVNLDGKASSIKHDLAELEPFVAEYKFEEMVGFEARRRVVPWNWKVSLENFSEAYHQPWVHTNTAELHTPANTGKYYDVEKPYNYSLFTLHDKNNNTIPSLFEPVSGMSDEFQRRVTVLNIYPYFHILTDPCLPVWLDFNLNKSGEHELVWTVFVTKEVAEREDMDAKLAEIKSFLEPILDEDIDICTGIAEGVQSKNTAQGRLCVMEKAVYQFHNWWLTKMKL